MSWGPIIVGVDASPAAAGAAAMAQQISQDAGVTCELVHAARNVWAALATVSSDEQVDEMQCLQLAVERQLVADALRDGVAPGMLEDMIVRFGPAAVVLQQVTRERRPGLLVLGGKHHTSLERWLGGSTSLHVVRTSEVPVLVTAGTPTAIRRVLVAADLSPAALPTLGLAERFAKLMGAQLRVVSVLEPLPVLGGVAPIDPTNYYQLSQELLEREVWPLIRTPGVEKVVRHGMVMDTVLREATEWRADVLVIGSHGKGWAQRVLLGSVTERVLNQLPTSLLVAPVGVAAAALRKRASRQPAGAGTR
jgi:nucleotide-binding universal stress UspA family protein